jgi:hypothetical protein
MEEDKKKRIHCHKCQNDTIQVLVFEKTEYEPIEVFFASLKGESRWIPEQRTWKVFECQGCSLINIELETIQYIHP